MRPYNFLNIIYYVVYDGLMLTPCRCLHIQDSTTLLQKKASYSTKLIHPSQL